MNKTEIQEVDGVLPEFFFNKNNVRIKKCCASCELHEPYDENGPHRWCTEQKKIMDKSDCCGLWVISEKINKVKVRPIYSKNGN